MSITYKRYFDILSYDKFYDLNLFKRYGDISFNQILSSFKIFILNKNKTIEG